jgi:hypothetical protein
MPHVFKIGISALQVGALAKRQGSLLGVCYGFNKAFGFLIIKVHFSESSS